MLNLVSFVCVYVFTRLFVHVKALREVFDCSKEYGKVFNLLKYSGTF